MEEPFVKRISHGELNMSKTNLRDILSCQYQIHNFSGICGQNRLRWRIPCGWKQSRWSYRQVTSAVYRPNTGMESPVRSGNWKTIGPTNGCDKLREPIADDHPEYCSIGNGIDIRPPHSSDDGNIRRNLGPGERWPV